MIQTDIQMATKIQKRLLPSKSPGDHISFYYQPMHDLGGDFLSFSQLPDGRTSFLISDVSGHGVTAAFITLMVKNTLEHEKNTLDQPDVTLTKLNEALFQQANNHFVTAICGVFDPENQKMLIACAGHVPPYLLHKGVSKKLILPSSGIPLGILPESKMDSGKKYKTYEYNFQKNDLVVFYTDGLSESRPVGNYESEDYETARMIPAMESMARLSPQQFMNELMQDARNYRNSPHFDDDICAMIWQV
jgi:serine phosphatase RsbU (regulator of sigma subunit)